jgi:hypothetical protein
MPAPKALPKPLTTAVAVEKDEQQQQQQQQQEGNRDQMKLYRSSHTAGLRWHRSN